MNSSRDDDSLSWGDEVDDPSYLDGRPAAPPAPAAADSALAASDGDGNAGDDGAPRGSAFGSALLVTYGILGGIYLLYSIGWAISIQRDTFTASNLFFEVMYQLGEFLAIAAPIGWLGLTFLLTRGKRPAWRVGWLVAGVLLLAPLPFIISGSGS